MSAASIAERADLIRVLRDYTNAVEAEPEQPAATVPDLHAQVDRLNNLVDGLLEFSMWATQVAIYESQTADEAMDIAHRFQLEVTQSPSWYYN